MSYSLSEMCKLLVRLLPIFAFLLVACSSGAGAATGVPTGDADSDSAVDTLEGDVSVVDPCAVKCPSADLVCDKVDGKCKPDGTGTKIGERCKESGKDARCGSNANSSCLNEAADGFSEGYCTYAPCSADKLCPIGSICAKVGMRESTCFKTCDIDADCRGGIDYKCQDVGSLYVSGGSRKVCYLPYFGCKGDEDCPKPLKCGGTDPKYCKSASG